jgi:hypothetical protein
VKDEMSFLGVGINGVVQIGSTAIANLKNASFSIKTDTVEEYVTGGTNPQQPALLAATNQHYELKAEQLWTDNAVLTDIIATGTLVTIIIGPNGIISGKPKYTFSGCVLNQFDLKLDSKSAVSNSFSAKATSVVIGTFP